MTTTTPRGTAVITGATGGIGALYAQGLAERGYDLLLIARDPAALQELAAGVSLSTGRKVQVAAYDLADGAQLHQLTERLGRDGSITLLANIAGAATFAPFTELPAAKIDQTIAVNIAALTQLSHAVAPGMVARGAGAIVNFASVLAFRPWAEFNVYNASKAYVVALSQSLQAQLRDKGVLVQVVAPPATATPFWQDAGFSYENLPSKAVMKVEDLAHAALLGLDRREEWVLPSLADLSVWMAYETGRGDLVKGMMSGALATRYARA